MRLLTWCLVLGACGDNTTAVVLEVEGRPDFIAFREGVGAWEAPAGVVDGCTTAYRLPVSSDYEVLVGCATAGRFYAREIQATLDDGTQSLYRVETGCAAVCDDARVHVAGQMKQAGTVTACDRSQDSKHAPWSFGLDVPPGPTEVVALIPQGMAIERTAASDVSVDVVADGAPYDRVPVEISGITPDGDVSPIVWFSTAHTVATLASGIASAAPPILSTSFAVAPGVLLEDDEVSTIAVSELSRGAASSRDVAIVVHRSETQTPVSTAMLPPLEGLHHETSGRFTEAWQPLPFDAADVRIELDGTSGRQAITASHRWLAAHGGSRVTFDVPPDYPADWNVDRLRAYGWTFTATVHEDRITRSTSISESHGVGPNRFAAPSASGARVPR